RGNKALQSNVEPDAGHKCLTTGAGNALARGMQLLPDRLPRRRLIMSMETQEGDIPAESSNSPFVLKGAGIMSGNSRWIFIGGLIGVIVLGLGGIAYPRYRETLGRHLRSPISIKARTQSLGLPGSSTPPAPIVIQLSADMVRVSAIALGHPRLAVINGKTVAEGDSIVLQAPDSSVALVLRVVRIGDGSIDLSDGKQLFSAQLTIPRPTLKPL